MQTLNQKKVISKNVKKSHILLFGSLLVFLGLIILSFNHFLKLREEVFSDILVAMSLEKNSLEDEVVLDDTPIVSNVTINDNVVDNSGSNNNYKPIDYSKYLGVLEIPSIRLKRGFYGTNSRYNNIQYNIAVVDKSSMPDVVNGNLILMGHSGDAWNAYFDSLFRMQMGADMYVTYAGNVYHYVLRNMYNVDKTGRVRIVRDYNITTLTLITCNKYDNTKQTVFIGELVL